MQLEIGVHLPRADLFLAAPADALQLVPEALALRVRQPVSPVLRVDAGEHARGQHGRRVAGAFLVGPVGDHDGMLRPDTKVVEGAHDFKAAQHAQHAVIFPAGRLRVEVAADIDRKRGRVRPGPGREHVAHAVEAHLAAGRLAPSLEERAALGVFVGQRLAVVAACDAGADLRHLHQAVPEPLAVDLQVLPGGGHGHLTLSNTLPIRRYQAPWTGQAESRGRRLQGRAPLPRAALPAAHRGTPAEMSMKCHVPSWGRSPPRPFARHCSLLAGLRSRTPRRRTSAPLARIMRAPAARARPPARCGGTLPSTVDVMECHVRSCAPPEMSCFVMRAVSAGLSARSASQAAARASAAGAGFGHVCFLPGKGRDRVSLFRAPLRGRACAAAGGRIAAARFARVIARARRHTHLARPFPPGSFSRPQPVAFCRNAERRPPGSRLSLLSFYTILPNVKPIREQKMKIPELFLGMPAAGTGGGRALRAGRRRRRSRC